MRNTFSAPGAFAALHERFRARARDWTATATLDRSLQWTPYRLAFEDADTGQEITYCSSGTSCTATLNEGGTYRARVLDSLGRAFGSSPSYLLTADGPEEQSADDIDLAALALLYPAGGPELCAAVAVSPVQTHVRQPPSTLSDETRACEEAVAAGLPVKKILALIIAASAGHIAWDLLHRGTIETLPPSTDPDVDSDTDAPTQPLPLGWPEDRLANLLMTKNDKLEAEDAKVLARQCLWLAARRPANAFRRCSTLPIFWTGFNHPEPRDHVRKALKANRQWVLLNYEYGAEKKLRTDREWYDGHCPGTRGEGEDCDEYPFFATEQGGEWAQPTPSLEYLNGVQNQAQGGIYGNFTQVCNLQSGTPPLPGMQTNSTGGELFVSIPLRKDDDIPTGYTCNR